MDIFTFIKDWQPSWVTVCLWLYFDSRYKRLATIFVNHKHDDEGKPVHVGNPDLLKD